MERYVSFGPLVLALIVAITVALRMLEHATGVRPYTIYYLLPVALAAAFVNQRFAYGASALCVILSSLFLFPHRYNTPDILEIAALIIASSFVASVVGRLRAVMLQLDRTKVSLIESEEQRVTFNREVLMAVTGGRILLCDDTEIAAMSNSSPTIAMPLLAPRDATILRKAVNSLAARIGLPRGRTADLSTAITEAATNAIKHGRGGFGTVWVENGVVVALIRDNGDGISPTDLARATLERGYSSGYSLGMGFTMILECVDSMALSTSDSGTKVLIKVGKGERRMPEAAYMTCQTDKG